MLYQSMYNTTHRLIVAIGIIYFLLASLFIWSNKQDDGRLHIISSDGVGYYSYLTNIFFEKNFTGQTADGRYFVENETGTVNKYYPGTALFLAPFMALGRAFDGGESMKGYADSYQVAVSIGAILYFILGLFFLDRLLISYKLSPSARILTILAIAFGTNLTNYVLEEPAMSHSYSWLCVTGFLLFYRRYHLRGHPSKELFLTSFFFGLVLLIRPVNGLVILFLPFLSDSRSGFAAALRSALQPKRLVPATAIASAIVGIHPLLVWIQSGSASLWTYQNEGFHFLEPAIFEFLFSWRKGLFLYTPIALSGISFTLFWSRKHHFKFVSFLVPMSLVIYVLSSWWNWYYGPSFSQRPFVEYLSLISIPLAVGIDRMQETGWKRICLVFLTLMIGLNLIQTYQYHAWILSRWDMTKEKYQYIFLKTDKKYKNILGGCHDIKPYNAQLELVFSSVCSVEKPNSHCSHGPTHEVEGNLMADYTNTVYNLLCEIALNESFLSKHELYVVASVESFEIDSSACSQAYVSIDMQDSLGVSYKYSAVRINHVPTEEWQIKRSHEYKILLPPVSSVKDKIKIYVWNPQKMSFLVDNLDVKIYRVD